MIAIILSFFSQYYLSSNEKHIELFTNNYNIINYKNINQIQKDNLLLSLKDDNNDPTFILSWGENNDLYLMIYGNIFYGMIGIKYIYGKYIIYNLYVNKKYRNLGYSKILLDFICNILKNKYKQNIAYLYCYHEMISFYYKLNWKFNYYDNYEQANLMVKNISFI